MKKESTYERISYYFRNRESDDSRPVIDDITWNDLDMEAFFETFNNTCSQNGGEYLYDMLRRPLVSRDDLPELKERGRVADLFKGNGELRNRYREALKDMEKTGDKSFYEMLSETERIKTEGNGIHYLALILGLLSIGLIFFNPPLGFIFFIPVSLFNVITYFRRRGDIEGSLYIFRYLIHEIRECGKLIKYPAPGLESHIGELKSHVLRLGSISRNSWIILTGKKLTGSFLELPLDFIRIFFHPDLIRFNNMLRTVRREKEAVYGLFNKTGFLDSMISLSIYREKLKTWSEPEFREGEGMSVKKGYHPLLKNPVTFDLCNESLILITGSNASGKSTFLKSAALLLILAETAYTVSAESFSCDFLTVITSMSLRDDIMGGDSLYTAEVRSVKRITSLKASGIKLAVFLDEVFKGTNTVERIASLSALLKAMASDSLCFAATHDTPLTHILEDIYSNYHFEEEISEDGITFPYELKKGRTDSRDAIKLLQVMGFDAEITDQAFALSDGFLKEGVWKKL